jgi:hypothetical protein
MYLLNSIYNLIAVEFNEFKGHNSDTPSMASTYFLKHYIDGWNLTDFRWVQVQPDKMKLQLRGIQPAQK